MDQLLPRKPQDVDRWSDEAERDGVADDVATGPQDRWANETARSDPDYPAPPAGGGTDALNRDLEDDGDLADDATDPAIHGQAR